MRRSHLRLVVILVGLCVLAPCASASYYVKPCKNAFSEEQEKTEGAKLIPTVIQQMPVLKDSDPVAQYVQRLGVKLSQQAPGYAWPYSFHVIASDEINAFAMPGGAIFINLATIQAADTEAQLAGVMAHEIAHVALRHSTCNITKQQTPGLLYGLGQLGGAIVGGGIGNAAAAGLGFVQNTHFLSMSRESEKQADLVGADILYDAGYDPRGIPQFFEVIQAKYGNGGAQWLSDHPNPGNRMEYVNAEIRTLPKRDKNIKTSDEFVAIKAKAAKMKPLTAEEIKSSKWKNSGDFQSISKNDAAPI